ncbi:hypothetical protein CALCODRAFT_23389 [Calocera cornea HHB12733]|uniref:Uncharacterized protein n=1 Tax=Calocera cornea HHB12733 TaxID=1353952 RepID=A0A165E462_9BASI|nr:hypothetical protein CALCODRAFT_23389 [Calocera cornea HHB12733]
MSTRRHHFKTDKPCMNGSAILLLTWLWIVSAHRGQKFADSGDNQYIFHAIARTSSEPVLNASQQFAFPAFWRFWFGLWSLTRAEPNRKAAFLMVQLEPRTSYAARYQVAVKDLK